jgi:hypothetical protein
VTFCWNLWGLPATFLYSNISQDCTASNTARRKWCYIYYIHISCITTTYQKKLWYSMDSRKICCTRYQNSVYLNIKTLCTGNTTIEYLCLAVMNSRLFNTTWKMNWKKAVCKNHATIHFTISKEHKILITLNLCYIVPCRNDCDITQKKRSLPLKHTVVNGQWQNILNTVLQNHTVEQNLTFTSLKEFVVLT